MLLNPTLVYRYRPWKIDIGSLLPDLLHHIEEQNGFDFRLLGTALLSSSVVYLRKVEDLLKLERPLPRPNRLRLNVWIPPPMYLPLRRGTTSTTVDHLLEALRIALEEAGNVSLEKGFKVILPPSESWLGIKTFLARLDEEAKTLYRRIEDAGIVSFLNFFGGLDREEMIKNFLLILFLAQQGKIEISQKEEGGDIYIEI
ncbi:MAG: hypothetical protein ACE5OY_05370 [Candidatus Bathyarchaeia archaeon]